MKVVGIMLLLVGMASFASAVSVPEIDSASAGSAVALLSGTLLVLKSRRRKAN